MFQHVCEVCGKKHAGLWCAPLGAAPKVQQLPQAHDWQHMQPWGTVECTRCGIDGFTIGAEDSCPGSPQVQQLPQSNECARSSRDQTRHLGNDSGAMLPGDTNGSSEFGIRLRCRFHSLMGECLGNGTSRCIGR